MSFLLDTDTCSAHLKGNRAVNSRFVQHFGALHVSVVTVGELHTRALRAAAPPERLVSLQELLNDLTVPDVTQEVAQRFGRSGPICSTSGSRRRTWTCSSRRPPSLTI